MERPTPRPYQQEAINRGYKHLSTGSGNNFICLPTGCHAPGTMVLMADLTTKAVEHIAIGDHVMGPDGLKRKVLKLHSGNEPMYRITPLSGGDAFEVNEGHIMALECTREGKGFPSSSKGGEQDYITVGEYLKKPKSWRHLRKLFRCNGIEQSHSESSRPIDPWMMGVLLGDGSMVNASVSICTPDPEIVTGIYAFASEWNCSVRVDGKKGNKASSYYFTTTGTSATGKEKNPIMNVLREMGMYGLVCENKFIPDAYKRASGYVRREVLAGLLDTDGHHNGSGGYDFISASKQLAEDVAFIARSLGITAFLKQCRKGCQTGAIGTYYRVTLSGNTEQIPCRVERKKPAVRKQKKNPLRSGFRIEAVGNGDFYGFTLDGDHLYLTADFTVHHNSGKSVVIAGIADMLEGSVLVLQPTAEILTQNWRRMKSYGYHPAMYSASVGRKQIAHITFAMVGSAINNIEHFLHFDHIIIDECHLVPEGEKAKKSSGPKRKKHEEEEQEKDTRPMYHRLVHAIQEAKGKPIPILGLTATPYRLTPNKSGAVVKFLGRSYPKFWDKLTYAVQISKLRDDGHLARLQYFRHKGIDPAQLVLNSTGSDYTDASVRAAFEAGGMTAKIVNIVDRLIKADRKRILVFTKFVEEAEEVAKFIPEARVIHGETPKAERQEILSGFDNGDIQVVCNVGVLTTGYDNPRLDTIVLARPTRSLSLYYQMVGRVMRPHPEKETGWVIDMVSLKDTFGEVEDLLVELDDKRLPIITGLIENSRTKQKVRVRLTNPVFNKHRHRNGERNYGSLANVR